MHDHDMELVFFMPGYAISKCQNCNYEVEQVS